jgi:transcriptional regulator with XRE-family HTH domain
MIALHISVQYTVHMQALFIARLYDSSMSKTVSRLRQQRERAGLTLRELARQINEQPSNVSFWERSGTLPRSDVLISISKAIGVSVEELLGQPRPQRSTLPGGRLGRVVEAVSQLPRRQQEKVIDIFETVLAGQLSKAASH